MTDPRVAEQVTAVNGAMQVLQALLGHDNVTDGRITFPRGYLLSVESWFGRLPWTQSYVVRKNASYTLMLYDVLGWLLRRTDLGGLAGEMVVKASLTALGSVAEALIVDATSPPLGRRQKMGTRVTHLQTTGTIKSDLAVELRWLWDMRNRQHLQELSAREFEVYHRPDVLRAEKALFAFCDALRDQRGAA